MIQISDMYTFFGYERRKKTMTFLKDVSDLYFYSIYNKTSNQKRLSPFFKINIS